MTFTDYYLKFDSQEDAESVLASLGFDGLHHEFACADVVGVIYAPTGEIVMIDGEPVERVTPIDGCHVNIRAWIDIGIPEQFIVTPKTPSRVWAQG